MKRSKLLALSLACGAGLLVPRAAVWANPVLSYTSTSGDPSVSQPTSQGWSYEGTNGTGFVSANGGYLASTGGSTAWVSPEFNISPGAYYQTTYSYVDQQATLQSTKGYVATFGANPAATYDLEQTNNALYWRTNGSAQNVSSPILYAGQLLHDDYNGVLPTGSSFTTASTIWQAPQNSTNGFVVFQGASTTNPLEIQSMNVTQVTSSQVLTWTGSLQAALNFQTTPSFNLPAGRFAQLPHTFAKLASGQPLKIAFMTDSIACDSENSLFNTMLEQDYPGAQITLYNATGHGTGTTAWLNPVAGNSTTGGLNLSNAVLAQHPDLVIMGGISSMANNTSNASIQGFHTLTADIKAADPNTDILYITGNDWDLMNTTQVHDYTANSSNVYGTIAFNRSLGLSTDYRNVLSQQAAADNAQYGDVAFFDTYGERGNYLMNEIFAEDGPNPTATQEATFFDKIHRDVTHSNDYGKDIDAQVLRAYFDGATSVPEPASLALIGVGSLSLLSRRRRRLNPSPNREGVCTAGHEAS